MERAMAARTETITISLAQDNELPTRQKSEAGSPLSLDSLREPQNLLPSSGEPEKPAKTRVGNRRRTALRATLAVLLLATAVGGGYLYWDSARHFETTDDAFI